MANIVEQILQYIAPITPYIEWLILFITPIYIAIGEVFSNIALVFIQILPADSRIISYIVMGVFIALGLVFGIMAEKKKKDNTEAGLEKNTYSPSSGKPKSSDDEEDEFSLPEPGVGTSTYFGNP